MQIFKVLASLKGKSQTFTWELRSPLLHADAKCGPSLSKDSTSEPSQEISQILWACSPCPGLFALKLITLLVLRTARLHLLQCIVIIGTRSLGQHQRTVVESRHYSFTWVFPFSATFCLYSNKSQRKILHFLTLSFWLLFRSILDQFIKWIVIVETTQQYTAVKLDPPQRLLRQSGIRNVIPIIQ